MEFPLLIYLMNEYATKKQFFYNLYATDTLPPFQNVGHFDLFDTLFCI
jgi:hypothetical protein